MTPITLRRHEITLVPESARVIIRPFIPSSVHCITTIIGRALAFSEEDTTRALEAVLKEFDSRHIDIESPLLANYERVVPYIFTQRPLSRARKLLIADEALPIGRPPPQHTPPLDGGLYGRM